MDARLSAGLCLAAVHLEGDKEIVIYQDDLEGKWPFTALALAQLHVPKGFRVGMREECDGKYSRLGSVVFTCEHETRRPGPHAYSPWESGNTSRAAWGEG